MNTDLFIGNLDRSVTSTDLEQLFSRHGRVQRAQVVLDKATGASKGFAFVSFATPEEAAQAISQLNGFDWNGRTLGVSYARPREAAGRGGARDAHQRFPTHGPAVKELHVTGLGPDTTEEELQEMLSPYGRVLKAKIVKDRETHRSRGFAFVQMSSSAENAAVIRALDGLSENGHTLSISEARERTPGGAGNSWQRPGASRSSPRHAS